MRHRCTCNGWIGNADIRLLKSVVCRALYFHANIIAKMIAPNAFNGLNASNGDLVVDLAKNVLAGDALLPNHDNEANL